MQVKSLTNEVAVAAGDDHTCALRSDGYAFCWGDNSYGQLGDTTVTDQHKPLSAVVGVSNGVALAAGRNHTCGLRAEGQVVFWGENSHGQLGDGTHTDRHTAVSVGLANSVALPAGGLHTCAVRADGRVFCWGANDFGQLGDGTSTSLSSPVEVPLFSASVVMADPSPTGIEAQGAMPFAVADDE